MCAVIDSPLSLICFQVENQLHLMKKSIDLKILYLTVVESSKSCNGFALDFVILFSSMLQAKITFDQ